MTITMDIRKSAIACAAGLIIGSAAAGPAVADPVMRQIDENRVSITDFNGKPPFRRRIVDIADLTEAEFARFEEIAAEPAIAEDRIGTTVRVVDFEGKPPFRRKVVEIDETNVTEFARFEEVEEPAERPRRRGAPGKGFPFGR